MSKEKERCPDCGEVHNFITIKTLFIELIDAPEGYDKEAALDEVEKYNLMDEIVMELEKYDVSKIDYNKERYEMTITTTHAAFVYAIGEWIK